MIARRSGEQEWDYIILDESQKIKNVNASTTKSVIEGRLDGKPIQAERKLFMTGTPMPNRAEELWTTFNYLRPDAFPDRMAYNYNQVFGSRGYRNYAYNHEELSAWFKSISIRRLKQNVLHDLPDKVRRTSMLTVKQSELSELHEVENQAYASAYAYGAGVLRIPFRLWSKVRAETARVKAIPSMEYILQWLYEHPEEKLVVFRHHEVTRLILEEGLKTCGFKYTLFEGGMNDRDKTDSVRDFQDGNARVIIVSTTSGGLAITLTAAHHCIFAEVDPVPANLIQAEDRLHRIGQTKDVEIDFLYTYGTIEAVMAGIVAAKLPTIEAIVDGKISGERIVEDNTDLDQLLSELSPERLYKIYCHLRDAEDWSDHLGRYVPMYARHHYSNFMAEWGHAWKGLKL